MSSSLGVSLGMRRANLSRGGIAYEGLHELIAMSNQEHSSSNTPESENPETTHTNIESVEQLEAALREANAPEEQIGHLTELSRQIWELNPYLRQALQGSLNLEELETILRERGISEEDIKQMIQEAKRVQAERRRRMQQDAGNK